MVSLPRRIRATSRRSSTSCTRFWTCRWITSRSRAPASPRRMRRSSSAVEKTREPELLTGQQAEQALAPLVRRERAGQQIHVPDADLRDGEREPQAFGRGLERLSRAFRVQAGRLLRFERDLDPFAVLE